MPSLLSWLPGPESENLSSSQVFPPIDADRIAERLRVEAKGVDDGGKERPASDHTVLDAHEKETVGEIDKLRRKGLERFREHMRVYEERIGSLEGFDNHIMLTVNHAETNFDREILQHRDDVRNARDDFNRVEAELKEFQEKNRIWRSSHGSEDLLPWLAVVLVIVAIESAFNGMFFADANVMGIAGGFMVATGISLINVFSAASLGALFRNVNHVNFIRKLSGWLFLLLLVALALSINFSVGHLRDAAAAVPLSEAPRLAMERVASGRYWMETMDAWLLATLGVVVAVIASWKAYIFTDPYPGYGRVWRKYERRRDLWTERKAEAVDSLIDARDNAADDLNEHLDNARTRVDDADAAYAESLELRDRLTVFLRECDSAADRLLTIYRDANRQNRTTPEPSYFREAFRFPSEPSGSAPSRPDAGAVTAFHVEVRNGIERIHRTCSDALKTFGADGGA